MAFLPESSTFDAGVYQLETTDPVLGGPSGVANASAKNLTNRTRFLKDTVDAHAAAIALRAPLASPALTGNPTAPTPPPGDNDTSIATTAFVVNALLAGAGGFGAESVVASATTTDVGAAPSRLISVSGVTTINSLGASAFVTTPLYMLRFQGALTLVTSAALQLFGAANITTAAGDVALFQYFGSGNWRMLGYWPYSGGLIAAGWASPALTGNPTAPTQTSSDNSTRIATTGFVQTISAAIVGGAPGTLNTLFKLAAAVGNDANFATTMNNALALKAPLASPALTGNPTAPTAAAGDNDTTIATTAFVETRAQGAQATAAAYADAKKAEAIASAATDATTKANAAQAAAIAAAATDATTKSNNARTAAIAAAATDASTKANAAQAAAISAAATDATNKANAAQTAAISAAATDATNKANAARTGAYNDATAWSSTDAQNKANTAQNNAYNAATQWSSTDAQNKANAAQNNAYAAAIGYSANDAQIRADTAQNAATAYALSLFANRSLEGIGYLILPHGFMIQWGTSDDFVTSDGALPFTNFATTFPNACRIVVASTKNPSGGANFDSVITIQAKYQHGFQARANTTTSQSSLAGYDYIAIGF